ncbi:MAG: T9SS type A sorting domain-containing protein [Saprospiraceae bacterium]|nr:T9SS type A sorting domain-containing protein [Saprospiraceae bacterium]
MKKYVLHGLILMVILLIQSMGASAQCIRHISHEVISTVPLDDGSCFATVEVCLQKSTNAAAFIDFQLNHHSGFLHETYETSGLGVGKIICHLFEFNTDCSMSISLTGYGRRADHSYCGIWTTLIPLPVELLSFKVNTADGKNRLEWTVAQEVNIRSYEIQKYTGSDFVTIFDQPAVAEEMIEYTYQYLDYDPEVITMYRLKIMEANGNFSYSPIISTQSSIIATSQLEIYPVPAHTFVIIEGASEVQVTNLSGQSSSYLLPSNGRLEVADWPRGLYLVRTTEGATGQIVIR